LPKQDKKLNLKIYKIRRPKLNLFLAFAYFIGFIISLFALKIYRLFRVISLKQLYETITNSFAQLDFAQQICTLLFLLTLVYLAIQITKRVKNFIFTEIIKVHLYLCINNTYLDYIIQPMMLNCYMTLECYIVSFFRAKFTFLNKPWFFDLICFLVENLSLILLFFFIAFDIYFNDYVLTKVFYIMPFCFLYSQWLYMSKFLMSKNTLIDAIIYKYLYTKVYYEDENIIVVADGSTIDIEARQEILNYIEKGFKTY